MKWLLDRPYLSGRIVALLVSAWIEISSYKILHTASKVALLVSAWIEIVMKENSLFLFRRTLRECVD